jgi:DHA3 family macrolide efflux protein-like MFS transporter
MLMLKALRNRAIALLWSGQVLSAIGDEVCRVALIWLAVGLIGADAGYLAAAQSGALLVLCLVGGHWADAWNQRRTMVGVDALRGAIVLVPVAAYSLGRMNLPLLVVVALALSGLGAFFDPALQATLPEVSPDAETLQAATGLMSTTSRLSRAVGPALVGVLAPFVATIHFFTLDALSFAVSALSVAALPPPPPRAPAPRRPRGSFRDSLASGFRATAEVPFMRELMLVRCAVGGLWGTAYSLGFALLVRALAPGDMRAFGWTVACYGVGNVAGALYVGNVRRRRPALILFSGYVLLGLGLAAMAAARSLAWLGAAAAVSAFGGPINDVPFVDIVQKLYAVEDLPKMFRLRMAVETGASLLLLAAAPALVRSFSARALVAYCGLGIAALGAAGLLAHAEPAAPRTSRQ